MEKVKVKGNGFIELKDITTGSDLINSKNDLNIVGIRINDELVNPNTKLKNNDQVEFISKNSITGNKIYQAGLKLLIEVALFEEFGKEYDFSINHSVQNGFHVTIEGPELFTEKEAARLKRKADQIVAEAEPITKLNIERNEAVKYYKSVNQIEKMRNTHNLTTHIIGLYKLKKHFNYYYMEMPTNTKYLADFDIISIDTNEVIISFKSNLSASDITGYIKYEKIINSYKDSRNWLKDQDISYLRNLNKKISSFEIKEVIKTCETSFNIKIQKTAEEIIAKNSKYVLIAGPSSSGKTTTTKKLALMLEALGHKPFMISVDDYFLDKIDSPKNEKGEYDFESIKAIDVDLLDNHLEKLINGETVLMPTYDFKEGKKVYKREVKLPNNSIILMEGLHCLNDELTKSVHPKDKYKIYLSPFMSLKIDEQNYISSTDVRIIRRIIRDKRTRNKSIENTIEYLEVLRSGEFNYIFPFVNQADAIINTSLPYELGVLKVYVEPLLYSIENDSPYYEEARRLINFLKIFFTIPSEYVRTDSIIREFIGGSDFGN